MKVTISYQQRNQTQ